MATNLADVQPKSKAVSSEILEPDSDPDIDPSCEVSRKRQSLSDLFTIVSGRSKLLAFSISVICLTDPLSSLQVALP